MKTLKYLVLAIFVIGLVSCSSDDDGPSYQFNKENLVGKYNLKEMTSKTEKNVVVQEGFDPVKITTEMTASVIDVTYDFTSQNILNQSGSFLLTTVTKQGEQTNEDQQIINVDDSDPLSFSVNEDSKTLTIDGEEFDVKNFKESGFTLERHVEETIDNGTQKTDITIRLERK